MCIYFKIEIVLTNFISRFLLSLCVSYFMNNEEKEGNRQVLSSPHMHYLFCFFF